MARLSKEERRPCSGINRYTATKEEARRLLAMLLDSASIELPHLKDDLLAFLTATERRLPSKAAVEKDCNRRSSSSGSKPAGGTNDA